MGSSNVAAYGKYQTLLEQLKPIEPDILMLRLKGALAVIDVDGCITADEGTSTL